MMNRNAVLTSLVFAQSAIACPELQSARPLSTSDGAAPTAFVTFEDPPVSAPFELIVEFCGSGEQIEAMAFDAIMPAHQHGMNYRVNVTNHGAQSFRVSNVVFHMPGQWELQIDAKTADQDFAYTGEIAVE